MEDLGFHQEQEPNNELGERDAEEEAKEIEGGAEHLSSPERKRVKPTLTIIIPEGFELNKGKYESTAWELSNRRVNSIEELRKQGYEYVNDKKVYPTPIEIRIMEIEGTETTHGWSGLIAGVGEKINPPVARLQTLEESFRHAQELLNMRPEERNQLIGDIDLVELGGFGSRQFFVDSDGRHRILTLKVLSELGCYISISGVKVIRLQRQY